MIRCLDIHTHHHAPQPYAVISSDMGTYNPAESQFYSIGVHPWKTGKDISPDEWKEFDRIAESDAIVAIGECGIDKLKGGPLYRQMIVFKHQVELSEKIGKPLIIHDVKSHDIIVGLKRDLKPVQNWVVHGFRGKPSLAKMMTDAGIFLSFGEKFNADSLLSMPEGMILAETDESSLSIQEIISYLSKAAGYDLTEVIAVNTMNFLFSKLED